MSLEDFVPTCVPSLPNLNPQTAGLLPCRVITGLMWFPKGG